jgi:hypothetical protein
VVEFCYYGDVGRVRVMSMEVRFVYKAHISEPLIASPAPHATGKTGRILDHVIPPSVLRRGGHDYKT